MQLRGLRRPLPFGVGLGAAVAVACGLGGCSSGASRFDFPSFGIAKNEPANADKTQTAALPPLPNEPTSAQGGYEPANYGGSGRSYGQGARYEGGSNSIARSDLPPPPAAPGSTARPFRETLKPPRGHETTQAPSKPTTVKAASGDTIYSLARKHGVPVAAILGANQGLTKGSTLKVGRAIKIPGGSAKSATVASASTRGESEPAVRTVKTTSIPIAKKEAEQPVRVAINSAMIPVPSTNPARSRTDSKAGDTDDAAKDDDEDKPTQSVASTEALPEPEPMSGNNFRWPVRGRVIADYGSKPNGSHNDGINVAVPLGTSVKAAENGVVAYAGSELKGYGNLILIRHSNNWVSAYAHTDEILVKRGDKVRRGQIIGKAGKSGSVTQPQLHFELRKGSRPVDPTKYMSDA